MVILLSALLVIISCFQSIYSNSSDQPVVVLYSGNDEVGQFSTAIKLKLTLSNTANSIYQVTVLPQQCCLDIDINDTDCDIIKLGQPQLITLGPSNSVNSTTTVTFTYRNLYARYRIGQCYFTISADGQIPTEWMHTLPFNTTPDDGAVNCSGIDKDPDRDCSPVDCAIKYKGKRNYYRKAIVKCEAVAPCNTRSRDGLTVTGYYDWENNVCVQYKWFQDDNYFQQIESDTEIPAEIDPSQSKYFPDLEPNLIANRSMKLDCHHGRQEGLHCLCDSGWISSGIRYDNPIDFHWCDTPEVSALTTQSLAPRKLSKPLEYTAIILMSIANLLLMVSWIYLLFKLTCPNYKQRCSRGLCCK